MSKSYKPRKDLPQVETVTVVEETRRTLTIYFKASRTNSSEIKLARESLGKDLGKVAGTSTQISNQLLVLQVVDKGEKLHQPCYSRDGSVLSHDFHYRGVYLDARFKKDKDCSNDNPTYSFLEVKPARF